MTTIDHQQAAVDSIRMWLLGLGSLTLDEVNDLAPKFVTAATPHLRAAWAADLVEKIKAEINDVDWDYGLNADAYLNGLRRVLALLEGGGACCEHSKCPGGSICCCQEGGAE